MSSLLLGMSKSRRELGVTGLGDTHEGVTVTAESSSIISIVSDFDISKGVRISWPWSSIESLKRKKYYEKIIKKKHRKSFLPNGLQRSI
jgi:hypothetical protein